MICCFLLVCVLSFHSPNSVFEEQFLILMKSNLPICSFFFFFGCFVAVCGLSLVAASRGYSSLWCAGCSLWWLLLLWSTGSKHAGFSSCGSWALERRLSSCGTRAYLLRSMWDLPESNPCPLHWQVDS